MGGSADAAHREFDAFVAEVSGSLLRTGYLMVGDLTDAEDAVQETLVRVARRWPRVRKMDRPLSYARRILLNVILDGARGRSRRRDELTERTPGHAAADPGDAAAERALRAVDSRLDLAAALAALAPRQRAVVVLRYWADLPETEVAAILGCSVGNVKSTASRALARLREMLSGPIPDPPGVMARPLDLDHGASAGDGADLTSVSAIPRSTR